MAVWPVDLPQKPLVQGFSETLPNLVARTPMDTGPAKVRRRSTAGVTQLQCVFRLTAAQRASLLTFWQTTLAGGSLNHYNVIGRIGPPEDLLNLSLAVVGGQALLRWDLAPDLDVQIGGYIMFRHTPDMDATIWPNSTSLARAIAGDQTHVYLPLKPGTYFGRVYDADGRPSTNATGISTKQASVLAFAPLGDVQEDPGFTGPKTRCQVVNDGLMLIAEDFDSIPDMDAEPLWDVSGGVIANGLYQFAANIDLGSVKRSRITSHLKIEAVNEHDYWDAKIGEIDSWADIDGTMGAVIDASIYGKLAWFDTGTGYVKLRNPTNTAWQTVGTIGPPMKWTNVDVPSSGWSTGDVKATYKVVADAGWVMMNDGSIGDANSGATTCFNADTWPLFNLLWWHTSDDWCKMYAAYTWTPTGRGASPEADFAAHRHIKLPKVLGRVLASAGIGEGLSAFGLATWHGAEFVTLGAENMPWHAHTFGVDIPAHTHPLGSPLPGYVSNKSSSSGPYTLADQSSGITNTGAGGGTTISGSTGGAGSSQPHFNIQPTTYVNYMIKL